MSDDCDIFFYLKMEKEKQLIFWQRSKISPESHSINSKTKTSVFSSYVYFCPKHIRHCILHVLKRHAQIMKSGQHNEEGHLRKHNEKQV